jgi:hypothetical protein
MWSLATISSDVVMALSAYLLDADIISLATTCR